jgi:hypothetical protein
MKRKRLKTARDLIADDTLSDPGGGGASLMKGRNSKRRGRPKGSINKITRLLAEDGMEVADRAGDALAAQKKYGSLCSEGGSKSYFKWLAVYEPEVFVGLLKKLIPG